MSEEVVGEKEKSGREKRLDRYIEGYSDSVGQDVKNALKNFKDGKKSREEVQEFVSSRIEVALNTIDAALDRLQKVEESNESENPKNPEDKKA